MSTLSLRLPNSLHRRLSEIAERDDVSINQLITSAVAEKMSALMTAEYFRERAARGSRAKFERALHKIPSKEPEAYDRLPNHCTGRAVLGVAVVVGERPNVPAVASRTTPARGRWAPDRSTAM